MWRNKLASVDSRLNCTEAPQDTDLLDITHHRLDIQSPQFGVHGVESTHEVFEEELKGLWHATLR